MHDITGKLKYYTLLIIIKYKLICSQGNLIRTPESVDLNPW